MDPIPKLQACLNDERSDLAVSEWLMHDWNHSPQASSTPTFMTAYQADQFLQTVNMDGLPSFFESGSDKVQSTIDSLRVMGLDDVAATIEHSTLLDESSAEFETNEQELMLASGKIEEATHRYIRDHVAEFERLES